MSVLQQADASTAVRYAPNCNRASSHADQTVTISQHRMLQTCARPTTGLILNPTVQSPVGFPGTQPEVAGKQHRAKDEHCPLIASNAIVMLSDTSNTAADSSELAAYLRLVTTLFAEQRRGAWQQG
jgi:hypothetical protein